MKNNIILEGFMGSGKTTVGIRLSYKLFMTVVDTDKLIEKEQGMTVSEIFEKEGEEAFREMETACLKKLFSWRRHTDSQGKQGIAKKTGNCCISACEASDGL